MLRWKSFLTPSQTSLAWRFARAHNLVPRLHCHRSPIFMGFRGPQAQANQLRKSSRTASHKNRPFFSMICSAG